jgi:hypothetical protein
MHLPCLERAPLGGHGRLHGRGEGDAEGVDLYTCAVPPLDHSCRKAETHCLRMDRRMACRMAVLVGRGDGVGEAAAPGGAKIGNARWSEDRQRPVEPRTACRRAFIGCGSAERRGAGGRWSKRRPGIWSSPVAAVGRSEKKRKRWRWEKRDVGKMDSFFRLGVEAPLCPPLWPDQMEPENRESPKL